MKNKFSIISVLIFWVGALAQAQLPAPGTSPSQAAGISGLRLLAVFDGQPPKEDANGLTLISQEDKIIDQRINPGYFDVKNEYGTPRWGHAFTKPSSCPHLIGRKEHEESVKPCARDENGRIVPGNCLWVKPRRIDTHEVASTYKITNRTKYITAEGQKGAGIGSMLAIFPSIALRLIMAGNPWAWPMTFALAIGFAVGMSLKFIRDAQKKPEIFQTTNRYETNNPVA